MTALESLLTKLASDEERERLAKEYENEAETKHGRCDYGCCYSSSRIVDAFDAGYTAAHARMSLLVEICRVMEQAMIKVGRDIFHSKSKGSSYGEKELERPSWWLVNRTPRAMAEICAGACGDANAADTTLAEAFAKIEAMAKEQG